MISRCWHFIQVALIVAIPLLTGGANAVNNADVQHFLDTVRGTAFTVHSDPTDPRYGRFSYSISDVGTYVGGDQDSIKQKKDGKGLVINFRGEVVFFSLSDLESPKATRVVIVNAQVGPIDGHATAVLMDKSISGANYQMVSHAPPGNAMQIVSNVVEAFENSDWVSLYELISSTFTEDVTVEEFVADLSTQEADVGSVMAVDVLSEPDIQFSPHGMWFFTVRTRVTYSVNGSLEFEDFVDYYVLEENEWRFWFSADD